MCTYEIYHSNSKIAKVPPTRVAMFYYDLLPEMTMYSNLLIQCKIMRLKVKPFTNVSIPCDNPKQLNISQGAH